MWSLLFFSRKFKTLEYYFSSLQFRKNCFSQKNVILLKKTIYLVDANDIFTFIFKLFNLSLFVACLRIYIIFDQFYFYFNFIKHLECA